MASNIKITDTVQELIDYTNDIKPYHSKIIEALIEYVGTETIEISVIEDFKLDIELLYEFDGNFVCLLGGYGTTSFGDPEDILVLSPDPTKSVLEYPALGAGYFIVLGDETVLFDPAVNISLSIASVFEDRLVDADASIGSPPTGGSFTVLGDRIAIYTPSSSFSITGSGFNDGDYVVASTTPIGSPIYATQINVAQSVPTNNVSGFVSVPDNTNTGNFVVIGSEFTEHLLSPHTTVYFTGLTLSPPATPDANRRFVSTISIQQPLTYNSVLSYTPHEGTIVSDIANLTTTSFSILGDFQSNNLFIGDEFVVEDSTGNDGVYTITSIVYEYDVTVADFVTKFGVSAVPDTTIDGSLALFIPSNVFILDGNNYTKFFVQGSRISITSGSYVGSYTALNSRFYNDKTYIRVRETLIETGTGMSILSTGANYISVDDDVTAIYTTNQQFNIVGSAKNDGFYTTASSVYNIPTNTTQISIVEPFDVTDASGEIFEFVSGNITLRPQGFGATVDLCEYVPQALVTTSFEEYFDVLFGHKFDIVATDSTTNKIYIQDNSYGDIYNIFVDGTTGSPTDTLVEIVSSGINNGQFNVTSVISSGSPNNMVELVVTGVGSPMLEDSGIYSGSPPTINGGFLVYKKWFQYFITDIDVDDFIVSGDATNDIISGMTIQHVSPENQYVVASAPIFDGTNTTITVTSPIIVGSPPVDGWIISI